GGNFTRTIGVPVDVGTVGGPLTSNKTVGLAHRVLGTERATELAEVMGAVGLAQNLSALRSLGTEGIQKGHMTLHARSVASTAGTPEELFDKVLERLLESGEIKAWKAIQLNDELRREHQQAAAASVERGAKGSESFGYGKIILTGEHSGVFGKHAVAASIALKMKAKVWVRPEDVC